MKSLAEELLLHLTSLLFCVSIITSLLFGFLHHHQVHSNLRSYVEQDGISNYREECTLVGGEIRTLKEDLELQMAQLAEEVREAVEMAVMRI